VPEPGKKAVLLLEDGTVFHGVGFGAEKTTTGEVVFNTGMVGYPESLTDPSYYGQILIQTWPLVGNYGIPSREILDDFGLPIHFESKRVQVAGYAISELQRSPSHWSSCETLDEWLVANDIPGIEGIDTRELTKKLRIQGTMLGLLSVGEKIDLEKLKEEARSLEDPNTLDLVRSVTVPEPVKHGVDGSPRVLLVDCGVKFGIIRNLTSRGASVVQVPYDTTAEGILRHDPDGIVISNGPGDPRMCSKTIESVCELLETKVPIFGICLGTQILALAAGGETYKLKFGHRAQNHPCVDLQTRRVYMTTQNHGYTVDEESLHDFEVSFANLNDNTVEGLKHQTRAVFGVQFHPEASPGPYETGFLFDHFVQRAREFRDSRQ
jgi:carbamoyl-phosphate synthase small subunit